MSESNGTAHAAKPKRTRKPKAPPAPALDIIPPGTPVKLSGGIDAGILAVTIGPNNHVRYRVVWWSGATRKTAWVESFEVAVVPAVDTEPLMGFHE